MDVTCMHRCICVKLNQWQRN